ncbi:MAG: hypothetical protein KDB69_02775 [Acidimicrobiia bacterium]|nr:hypothetical protein [Acidimicrobiia bacterium]
MTVEGLAAMLVFFVLLTVIVQIGFLVVARSAAIGAVDSATRRASFDAGDLESVADRLRRDLAATVPGSDHADVDISRSGDVVTVSVGFDWLPPGPDLVPIRIAVERSKALVVAP